MADDEPVFADSTPSEIPASTMDEQKTTESNMADAQPVFADYAPSGGLTSTMADSEDSRTATAGRKRDFQEATSYEDTNENVSDYEPSQKRLKDDGELSRFAHAEASSIANVSSEIPAPALANEAADLSRLPAVEGSSVFTMLKEHPNEGQFSVPSGQAPSPAQPSTTWNAGVQSGLRTSFGSKAKGKALTRTFDGDVEMNKTNTSPKGVCNEELDEDDYDMGDPLLDDSEHVLQPTVSQQKVQEQSNNPVAPQTFIKLSKGQRKKLGKSEKQAYDLAHKQHLLKEHIAAMEANQNNGSRKQLKGSPSSVLNDELHTELDSEGDRDSLDSDEDDDEEEVDDYDLYDDEEHHTSQLPQNVSNDMLTAAGRPPVHPPYFQKATRGQKNNMSKEEKKKYQDAACEYGQALQRYESALSEYNAKLGIPRAPRPLPPDFAKNPRKLKKGQISKLSAHDKVIYKETYTAHRKIMRRAEIENTHKDVEMVINSVKQWPLPKHYASTTVLMGKGKSWYPSHRFEKNGVRPYTCNAGTFEIYEIFDSNGLPISVQQFSFNVFVPRFLERNRNLLKNLNGSILKSAFNFYLLTFYPHTMELLDQTRSTADAPDAITLGAAKKQIGISTGSGLPSTQIAAVSIDADTDMIGQDTAKEASPLLMSISSTSENPQNNLSQVQMQSIPSKLEHKDADTDMFAIATSQAADQTPKPSPATMEDHNLRETIMFLQDKYYPSASDEIRCLVCAQLGHISVTCPELNCVTCGIQGKHSTVMCPREMPCGRCRSRGHSLDDCPEKLAMPRSEMTCDLCGASNHMETECHRIWRSYEPPKKVVRVSGIPVYCYSCGDADHYGPDCALYQGAGVRDADYTFTGVNLFRYLDRNSQRRAISAGIDYSIPRPKNSKSYNIKGKGKANDPITLDDSDDEEFIRPSVMSGNVPRGNITFGKKGQPPQAPSRSTHPGPNQMNVTIRGGRNTRGGGRGSGRGSRQSSDMITQPGRSKKPKKPRHAAKAAQAGEGTGNRR